MEEHVEKYEKLIRKFTTWAEDIKDIRGTIVVGSRARKETPADKWSDLDLVILTTNPDYYLNNTKWIEKIEDYWITFIENTAVGGSKERRVLFKEGLDVDFSIFTVQILKEMIENYEIQAVLNRGIRVLIDKDNLFNNISNSLADFELKSSNIPSIKEFDNLINDFWYHAVWSSKKLLRGELWTAKSCVDGYMKYKLIKLIEWHAVIKKGEDYDTWHSGRYFDEWADDKVKEDIKKCFAHYNKEDIKRALYNTMSLFRWIALEVSSELNYKYPVSVDNKATQWIEENLIQN